MRTSNVQRLRDQGFDESYAVPFEHTWRVLCSQCEALVLNGTRGLMGKAAIRRRGTSCGCHPGSPGSPPSTRKENSLTILSPDITVWAWRITR